MYQYSVTPKEGAYEVRKALKGVHQETKMMSREQFDLWTTDLAPNIEYINAFDEHTGEYLSTLRFKDGQIMQTNIPEGPEARSIHQLNLIDRKKRLAIEGSKELVPIGIRDMMFPESQPLTMMNNKTFMQLNVALDNTFKNLFTSLGNTSLEQRMRDETLLSQGNANNLALAIIDEKLKQIALLPDNSEKQLAVIRSVLADFGTGIGNGIQNSVSPIISELNMKMAQFVDAVSGRIINYSEDLNNSSKQLITTKNSLEEVKNNLAASNNQLALVLQNTREKEKQFQEQMEKFNKERINIAISEKKIKENEQIVAAFRAEYASYMQSQQKKEEQIRQQSSEMMVLMKTTVEKFVSNKNLLEDTKTDATKMVVFNRLVGQQQALNEKAMNVYNSMEQRLTKLDHSIKENSLMEIEEKKTMSNELEVFRKGITSITSSFGGFKTDIESVITNVNKSAVEVVNTGKTLTQLTTNMNKLLVTMEQKGEIKTEVVPFDYNKIKTEMREFLTELIKERPRQEAIVTTIPTEFKNILSGILSTQENIFNRLIKEEKMEGLKPIKKEPMEDYPMIKEVNYEDMSKMINKFNERIFNSVVEQIDVFTNAQETNTRLLLGALNNININQNVHGGDPFIMPRDFTIPRFVYINDYNTISSNRMGSNDINRTRNYTSLAGQKRSLNNKHGLSIIPGREPDPFIDSEFHTKKIRNAPRERAKKIMAKSNKSRSNRLDSIF